MPKAGDAYFELSLRDAEVLRALQRTEGRIRATGSAAEDAFDDKASGGLRKLGDAAETTGRKAATAGEKLRGFGTGILQGIGQQATFLATQALSGLGDAIIGGATDWAENLNKVRVVFGDLSSEVEKFATTAPAALGLSQSAALGAAGTFGNLFTALKLPSDEAVVMSKGLLTLASDLASFNNIPVTDALDKLRAGLVGETEPLRALGVNMNDATLRTKALELGLITSIKDGLEPAAKAQAAYALIMEQTGKAQGDFARTSGGLANQQRIAAAQIQDGLAKIGMRLTPIIEKLLPPLIVGLTAAFDLIGTGVDVLIALAASGKDAIDFFLGPAVPVTAALAGVMGILVGQAVLGSLVGHMRSITSLGPAVVEGLKSLMGAGPQISAAGTTGGRAYGLAFQAGALLGIAAIAPEVLKAITPTESQYQASVFAGTIFEDIGNAFEDLGEWDWPIGQKNAPDWAYLGGQAAEGMASVGQEMSDAGVAAFESRWMKDAPRVFGGSWAAAARTPLEDSFATLFTPITALAEVEGKRLPRVFADGILAARQAPLDALSELKVLMKTSLSETAETARLLGQLTSDELAAGMDDRDAAVRNAAVGARNAIINQLEELAPSAGTLTKEAMDALVAAMDSKDPVIAAAAKRIFDSVKNGLPSASDGRSWGRAVAEAYADGLDEKAERIYESAQRAVSGARRVFQAFSPPGPDSPLHDIDKWGAATAQSYVDAFSGTMNRGMAGAFGMSSGPSAAAALAAPVGPAQIGQLANVVGPAATVPAGPLVTIENFYGTQENIDRLLDSIGERLRIQLPYRALGTNA